MGVIGVILLVAFVIICVLLVILVLLQNEEGGLGGLLGGSNTTTFGSRTGNVLTKTTYILVTLFFITVLALALINKGSTVDTLDPEAIKAQETTTVEEYWNEGTTEAPTELKAN